MHKPLQGLENTLWAFATLGRAPRERVLAAGAVRLAETLRDFNQQNLALTLWAFAKLGFCPPTAILQAAADRAVVLAPVRPLPCLLTQTMLLRTCMQAGFVDLPGSATSPPEPHRGCT